MLDVGNKTMIKTNIPSGVFHLLAGSWWMHINDLGSISAVYQGRWGANVGSTEEQDLLFCFQILYIVSTYLSSSSYLSLEMT